MELKYFKTLLLFLILLLTTKSSAQTLVNSEVPNKKELFTSTQTKLQKNALLKRLVRNGVSYLQIVEDDVVFLQIVEDDVVFLKRIINEGIKIRRTSINNKKVVQFLKGTELLKSIVEDDVVFLESIVEDDVVFLESIVEDDVVFLKCKDKNNLALPTAYGQTIVDKEQRENSTNATSNALLDSLKNANALRHLSLGVSAGVTNLPGLDLAYKFLPHFTLRVGFGYFDYQKNNFRYDITSKNAVGETFTKSVSMNVAAHFSNASGLVEYSAGQKGRFRIIAGAAFFMQKKLTASGELMNDAELNAISLKPSDVGSGDVAISFAQKLSPYLGFGIGRATPRRRLNLSLDAGAYYMSDYRVKININPGVLLKENEQNGPIIEKNLNAKFLNKVLPSLNLRMAYRLL
jgi:hypothetical protein